jgi:predicted TIM-barrel fold metal-dependent hydrolase
MSTITVHDDTQRCARRGLDGAGIAALGLWLLTIGCAPRPATVEPPARPPAEAPSEARPVLRRDIAPKVAHHQHLMSPASVELLTGKPRPTSVQLPAPLADLIKRREAMAGGATKGDVYTEDAMIVEIGDDRWARGRATAEAMAAKYLPGSRFLVTGYGLDGKSGWIAGTVRGEGKTDDGLVFLLAVVKGADKVWRIAAEETMRRRPPAYGAPVTADDLIAQLDDARIERGVVFSTAYWWASPKYTVEAPDEKVRADNDWTAAQVARYPDRLLFFCGVNPIADGAIAELERCATLPQMRGMKIHIGNSRIDILKNPEHLAKLKAFFRAANGRKLAVVAHLRTHEGYGRGHSEMFLKEVLPEAPDIPIQVAHMAGAGPGYGPDEVMAPFAEAVAAGDPRTRNLLFDLTTVVTETTTPEEAALIVKRIREVGVARVLFGSDMAVGTNPPAATAWATIRRKLPLTDEELRTIADNVAPYMR